MIDCNTSIMCEMVLGVVGVCIITRSSDGWAISIVFTRVNKTERRAGSSLNAY